MAQKAINEVRQAEKQAEQIEQESLQQKKEMVDQAGCKRSKRPERRALPTGRTTGGSGEEREDAGSGEADSAASPIGPAKARRNPERYFKEHFLV